MLSCFAKESLILTKHLTQNHPNLLPLHNPILNPEDMSDVPITKAYSKLPSDKIISINVTKNINTSNLQLYCGICIQVSKKLVIVSLQTSCEYFDEARDSISEVAF
jgi:hypothetical protein